MLKASPVKDEVRSGLDHPAINVGPLQVDRLSERQLLRILADCVRTQRGCVLTYAHIHTLWRASKDTVFAENIKQCDLCYCDGIGVSYASLLQNGQWITKVTANNFVQSFANIAATKKWRIALIGSRSETVATVQSYFTQNGVSVVYAHDGYFDARQGEILCSDLSATAPDIVLVGMGQPRQEEFAQAMKGRLPNTVLYCVGGLFPFIAGDEGRCPMWMRRVGFEWMFRLAADPVRLWRRYLLNGPILLLRALIHIQ